VGTSTGETDEGASVGRIRIGMSMAKASWRVLRDDPKLLVLPMLSAGACAVAMLALVVPTVLLVTGEHTQAPIYPALAIGFYAVTFLGTYFGVAFAAVVGRRLDGRPASLKDGFAAANDRLGAIGWWTFIAGTVGLLIRAIRALPGLGELAESAISAVLGFAWGATTFFVIPILATERRGAKESITRSAAVLKERWGESGVGFISITAVFFLISLPVVVVFFVVAAALAKAAPAVVVLAAVMMVIALLALALAQTALQQVFRVVLFRYANGQPVPAQFDERTLDQAAQPRRRGLFGRRR
jgi:hypothetical protein